jgi:pimeloyl-ACP methyl ester carboxylesterase
VKAIPLFASIGCAAALGWGCSGNDSQTSTTVSSSSSASSSSGSGGGGGGAGGSVAFCQGKTELLYDPGSKQVDAFPDDYFSVDDASTVTGERVAMVLDKDVAPPASGASFKTVFDDISTLDGFGTTAALAITFSAPLDPKSLPKGGDGSGKADASVVIVNLDSPSAEFVDFDVELVPEKTGDPKTTLILTPTMPLAPTTRYGLVVTNRAHDAHGGCIAPSATMQELLAGKATSPKLTRLAGRFADLIKRLTAAGTIDGPGDISGATVFTTQHTVDDSAAIAKFIRAAAPPTYTAIGACTDPGATLTYLICEGSFPASDFRVARRAVDEAHHQPQDTYILPVTTYLPKTGTAPFPTIIYGHGLGGDRHQAEELAVLASPEGYATVAIDAVKHGNHPDGPGSLGSAASFFGLSVNLSDPLDSIALRDHWRQSTYDKLQLLELLRGGVDADGDGNADVNIDRFLYLGVSLGGIMSAEFTAFAPELDLSIPIVPGARVTNIIKDGAMFSQVIALLKGQATDGQIARFFPIVQTVVDRGDAGAYTQHMVGERLPGFASRTPQVLMQMVIADDTVPNPENLFFAHGLGVPHVGDELLKIGVIPHQQALPVSANLDATHTGGVFQFDIDYVGDGPMTQMATHSNVAGNPVAIAQSLHFIDSYYAAGVSEIIDPYRTLGIKP